MNRSYPIYIVLIIILSLCAQLVMAATQVGSTPAQFSVNNGTVSYSIPLQLAPGRSGSAPDLALTYSGSSGNGALGMGWSIGGLSSLHRCPEKINPAGIQFNTFDRYCLDGQELINVSGHYHSIGTEYRTEIDSYAQIVSAGGVSGNPDRFVVKTKAGQEIVYGGGANASTTFPQGTSRWSVRETNDSTGNNPVTYNYTYDNHTQLIDEVLYTGGRVKFIYSARPDVSTSYLLGNEIRVTQRLSEIQVYAQNSLMKVYRLSYENVGLGNISRITQIQECDDQNDCLVPTQFEWTATNIAVSYGAYTGGTLNTANFGNTSDYKKLTGDFNGDGLTDLVWMNKGTGGLRAYTALSDGDGSFAPASGGLLHSGHFNLQPTVGEFNGDGQLDIIWLGSDHNSVNTYLALGRGDGSFDPVIIDEGSRTGIDFSGAFGVVIDANVDGKTDVVWQKLNGSGASVYTTEGHFSSTTEEPFFFQPNGAPLTSGSDLNGFTAVVGDFNGDGRSDLGWLLANGNGLYAYTALRGYGGFEDVTGDHQILSGNFSGASSLTGDVNSDGVTDAIWLYSGAAGLRVYTAIGRGDGGFETPAGETLLSGDFGSHDHYEKQLGDMNADGFLDAVWIRTSPTGVEVYTALGRGDGSFSSPSHDVLHSGHFGNSPSKYSKLIGDFDGNSVSDIAWLTSDTSGLKAFTVLSNLNRSGLLTSITSSAGVETHIRYAPLTDPIVYTKGSGSIFPEVDVQIAQYVVREVETGNGVGGSSRVRYHYQGLKAHMQGRGSYGYRKITETYPETGKTLETTFDQSGFPFIGRAISQVERYNGQIINQSTTSYAQREVYTNVFAVNLDQSVESSYELNGNLITQVTTAHEQIDDYGNIGRVTVTTSGGGQTFTKITDSIYNNDVTNWYLGRLTSLTVTHQSPYGADQVRRSLFTYHASTGLLATEQVVSVATGTPLTTISYTYDIYGQETQKILAATGESNRVTNKTYDGLGRLTQECNAYNECKTLTYTTEGWLDSSTGPNGLTSTFEYDGFGRNVAGHRADGVSTIIARHFVSSGQCDETVPHAYTCSITQETGMPATTVQYDTYDREVRRITQGFDGRLIYKDTQYNYLLQMSKMSREYYAGDHVYWGTTEFDVLDRVIKVTEPGPNGSTTEVLSSYNGLTTITSSGPDTREKTTATDALGQVIYQGEEENTFVRYTYTSDGLLATTTVADDPNTIIALSYDEFGRKVAMDDPDMGYWTYSYNGFDQISSQTNAKSQTTTMVYDLLGRMVQRHAPEGVSTWTYGSTNAPQGSVGKLLQETGLGVSKSYQYDNFGRLIQVNTSINGEGSFVTQTEYDSLSRVSRVTYPGTQGFFTENVYNSNGFLSQVRGLRSHAEEHDLSQLQPLIQQAVDLADDYLAEANQLRTLGQYYQTQITNFSALQTHLQTHQTLLSEQVAEGQTTEIKTTVARYIPIRLGGGISIPLATSQKTMAMSSTFMNHLNNTVVELQTVQNLIAQQAQNYEDIAEQLTVLAEQTLAAADHSFQYSHNLDMAADAYSDMLSDANYITYWRAAGMDASGRISAEVYGNGMVNDYAYNQATGQLQRIRSSLLATGPVRHLEYQYDAYNNVTLRDDLVNDIHETYGYDRLDRLTTTSVNSGLYSSNAFNRTQTTNYDVFGNITYKSDVGHYSYATTPHAVTQAGGLNYTYDANGNMTGGAGRTVQWSSFNKPTQITQSGRSATFSYGPNHKRYQKVNHQGDVTLYIGKLYERTSRGNTTEQKHMVYAGGQLIATHILSTSAGTQTRYLHKDALGSIDLITDAYANVVDRRSFDAWGQMRDLPWQTQASLQDPLYLTQLPFTNLAYTGHETVQEVDLIHMNGRVYDATLARFLSADPHIQASNLSQSYNRYAYVLNNPMKYTDPSGFFFNKVGKALNNSWKAVKPYAGIIAGAAATAAVTAYCPSCGVMMTAAIAGASAGATHALANGGNIFKGAITGFLSGLVFGAIGAADISSLARIAAHATAGGVMSVVQGGKFGHGFISAGFTKFATLNARFSYQNQSYTAVVQRTSTAAVIGGTSSKLVNGNFANGARSASAAHLFNAELSASRTHALDNFQTGLDVAGLTPAVGIFADGLNVLVSLFRGDLTGAGLSAVAMVPVLGQGAAAAKLAASGGDKTVDVYRAFGGDARAQGFSWTTTDPLTVSNFRDVAGLPSGGESGATNTAEFLIKGKVNVSDIIKSRSALPLDGNKGGLPELIIDPKNVNITDFSVLKQ